MQGVFEFLYTKITAFIFDVCVCVLVYCILMRSDHYIVAFLTHCIYGMKYFVSVHHWDRVILRIQIVVGKKSTVHGTNPVKK